MECRQLRHLWCRLRETHSHHCDIDRRAVPRADVRAWHYVAIGKRTGTFGRPTQRMPQQTELRMQ